MADIFTGIAGIGSSSIIGNISRLSVAQVKPGDYIDIDISFEASNPGALYWKLFLVAMDNLGNKELVQATRVLGGSFTKSDRYRLWKMPSQTITIDVRLFGHDDAAYDWHWSDWR